MRYLTFLVAGVRLGIKVDSVDSVGKSRVAQLKGSNAIADTIVLARELGFVSSTEKEPTIINCRVGKSHYQLLVDKVLDLYNVGETDCQAWPPSLEFLKVYNGVVMAGQQLFFSLDLERIVSKNHR